MVSLKQVSFSGGLIAPQLLGRSDQVKYSSGLRQCSNALVQRFGGIENRPGTQFTDDLTPLGAPASVPVRLVPFVFNFANAYQLVFCGGVISVYKNNVPVSVALGSMTAWSSATAYVMGNIVSSGGAGWICQTPNTNQAPSAMTSYWAPMSTNGAGNYLVQIPTTNPSFGIGNAAYPTFQYVQLNDVMTITHQSFLPMQLTRTSDVNWTLTQFVQSTSIASPANVNLVIGVGPGTSPAAPATLAASGSGSGSGTSAYFVTAYNGTYEGPVSPVANANTKPGAGGGQAITLTWASVSGATGYIVYRGDNGNPKGIVAVIPSGTTTFIDADVVPTPPGSVHAPPTGTPGSTVFTYVVTAVSAGNGAESLASTPVSATGGTPTAGNPNIISWNAVTGATSYNIYSIVQGVPGLIGTVTTLFFNDTNFIPNFGDQPPVAIALFTTTNDYPAVCAYFQQRLLFANTINQPETVWGSRVGTYGDFAVSTPIADDDAFQFTVAGSQAQPVQALVDLGKLVIHTASAEYIATGNQFGTITPTAINLVQQGTAGSQLIRPITIGPTDIFVQARGNQIRDLKFNIQDYSYTGKDLTIFASGLFIGRTVVDMAWQNIHDSIIWFVLDNGTVLGLTYLREHDIWAWHQHAFAGGFVEAVSVVPNGQQDVISFSVRRTINGVSKRYLERFANRDFLDTVLLTDAIFADCALQYNGTNTGATTMTATTGATWTPEDTITLTASASTFALSDIGNVVVFTQYDPASGLATAQIGVEITGYTSATVVSGTPQGNVPLWAQGVALTTWGKAVATFSGATQLAGATVSVLADGNVVANPLNPALPALTISTGGAFTLPSPALVVTVGLPIQTDVQTMPLENPQGETIADKRVTVHEAYPILFNSRGGLYGQDSAHLKTWKQPRTQYPNQVVLGYPVTLWTGIAPAVPIQGTPQLTGQIWVRLIDPVPWAMSALVVSAEVGK